MLTLKLAAVGKPPMLHEELPDIVLILTLHPEAGDAEQLTAAGVSGYVLKHSGSEECLAPTPLRENPE